MTPVICLSINCKFNLKLFFFSFTDTVTFDNSYSIFRSKVLHYYVTVIDSLSKLDIEENPEAKIQTTETNVVETIKVD